MKNWVAPTWIGASTSWRRGFFTIAAVLALTLLIFAMCDLRQRPETGILQDSKLPLFLTKFIGQSPVSSAKDRFTIKPDTTRSAQLDALKQEDLENMPSNQLEELYFSILRQLHVRCPTSERIGDIMDGGWDVCMSEPYDIRQSKPCVAFSFGINYIWGYDDVLADKFNCKVYMFDPSLTRLKDHKRKETSWFFLTGLASSNHENKKGWKMRTLCDLFKELGYADKTVDILKVDIEFFEWESFERALEDGCLVRVKQLLFESHTSEMNQQKSDYRRFIRVWQGLFKVGFRSWKWHENPQSIYYNSPPNGPNRACCYEHYLINNRFL